MVQAAAQAQAVVAAAKSKGDGLVPMNSAQITALSQIQAQAIVHARKSQGTPQQIQTQIQLQAQALVHAHTQVRIYRFSNERTNDDCHYDFDTLTRKLHLLRLDYPRLKSRRESIVEKKPPRRRFHRGRPPRLPSRQVPPRPVVTLPCPQPRRPRRRLNLLGAMFPIPSS